jgi:hypothetical protein
MTVTAAADRGEKPARSKAASHVPGTTCAREGCSSPLYLAGMRGGSEYCSRLCEYPASVPERDESEIVVDHSPRI